MPQSNQTRLTLFLAVLLLVAGGVGTLLLWPETSDTPPALNRFAESGASACSGPEENSSGSDSSHGADFRGPRSGRDDDPGSRTDPSPEPGGGRVLPEFDEDDWILKGKVKLKLEIAFDLASRMGRGSDLVLIFVPAARDDDDSPEFWIELETDLQFQDSADDSDFGIEPGDRLPSGSWYAFLGSDEYEKFSGDPEEFPASARVSPRISGRVIEFGTIERTLEQIFADQLMITGRVLGAGGTPLRYGGEYVLEADNFNWEFDLHLDHEGYFLVSTEADEWEDADKGARLPWVLWLNQEELGATGVESAIQLKPPSRKGNVLDFGTINLGGGLLEVSVHGIEERPKTGASGGLVRDEWGYTNGPFIEIQFESGAFWADTMAHVSPHNRMVWLPEGRYRYEVSVESDEAWYEIPAGVVVVHAGRVTQLKLQAVERPTVEVKVRADGRWLHQVDLLRWDLGNKEATISGNVSLPLRVPVDEDSTTSIIVTHAGYARGHAEVRFGDTEVVIELTRGADGRTGLLVQLPPRSKQWSASDEYYVQVRGKGYWYAFNVDLRSESPESIDLDDPGSYQVWLTSDRAMRMGYEGGVMGGIVEVEVIAGERASVRLPEIAPPPWEFAADKIWTVARCDGRPIDLQAPGEFEGGRRMPVTFDDGKEFKGPAPQTIVDGDDGPQVELAPPSQKGGSAFVKIDLPVRVEVRVTRRGKPLDRFHVKIEGRGRGSSIGTVCKAAGRDGIAKLWWPVGTAHITTDFGGYDIDKRNISVRAGSLTIVEVSTDRVAVKFIHPDDQSDDEEEEWGPGVAEKDYADWVIQRVVNGRVDPPIIDEIWGTETKLMEVGRYRVVPAPPGDPMLAFDLDLSSGEDRTVNLPKLKKLEGGGRIRLSLPERLLQLEDPYFEIHAKPLNVAESILTTPAFDEIKVWLSHRFLANGMLLTGVPVGIEVVLVGEIWIDDDDEVWILHPVKVKAVKNKTVDVSAVWQKAVKLHDEWEELDAWSLGLLPGVCLSFSSGGEYALPGRYEITIFDDGKAAMRQTVTFSATEGGFRIPPNMRAELIRLELLDDE